MRLSCWNSQKTPYPFHIKKCDNPINAGDLPNTPTPKQTIKQTGCYNYGARYYNPKTSLWLSVNPLAEKYPGVSSYTYCMNNPVNLVDPDGRELVLTGNKAKKTLKQLKASTNLTLKMAKNGKITAKGKAKTDADKKLLEAINDSDVIVQVKGTLSNFTDSGNWYVGGAYGGSEVKVDGKTYTIQTVYPKMTGKIDKFYGAEKGVSIMHEIIEPYIGGVDSPGVGAPTFDNTTPEYKAYLNAHNKADATDPRHVAPNIVVDTEIYISKFPYDPNIPKALNPEILINNLKK